MSSLDALTILVTALIATSGVELVKDVTPLRYAFNRWAVQRWLWRGLDLKIRPTAQLSAIIFGNWLEPGSIFRPSYKRPRRFALLEERVVELAACGQRAALYRPPLAQIAGQLQLLSERLLDFPAVDEADDEAGGREDYSVDDEADDNTVLRAIAGVSVERPQGSRSQPDDDLKRLAGLTKGFRAALAEADERAKRTTSTEGDKPSIETGELIDTRTRVTAWVQGRLNELQTTGFIAWRIVLLALAIGLAIGVVLLSGRGTWLDGVFAGVLAPVGYELVSMVKRVGRA